MINIDTMNRRTINLAKIFTFCLILAGLPVLAKALLYQQDQTSACSQASSWRLVSNNGTYYLIQNGQIQGVTSPGILFSYGFEFKDAAPATATDLALPQGGLLLPNGGALVKSIQDKTVYLVSDGQRHAFVSSRIFYGLGFKFSSVLLVTNPELQALPKGYEITDSGIAHLDGLNISYKGTIYQINNGSKNPYPSLAVYNSWNIDNDFSRVIPANKADLTLPVGSVITDRACGTSSIPVGATPQVSPTPPASISPTSTPIIYGGGGGGGSPAPTPDTTAPTVSITAPTDGSIVSGSSVTLSATASDNVGIAGVTFKIGGVVIGSEVATSPYSITWDSTATSSGSKSIVAVARDTSNNLTTSTAVTVTSDNTAPVISSIATSSPTTTTLLVTWTTDELSDSKIDYGITSSYGTASTSATLTTSHSLTLTGLDPTTAYYFRIQSTDAQGNIAVSSDQTLPLLAYYVDSVNGNDANTGLSATQSVQTIAHLTTIDATSPLNTWNLATDSHWREQVTVPRDNMTVQAYGTGTNKPLVDASSIVASWTKTGGLIAVYETTVTAPLAANNTKPYVWEDGVFLVRATSAANCDATAGSYYPSSETASPYTLYVHATGSGDPAVNGKLYETNTRLYGVEAFARTNTTIHGVWTRRNLGTDGSIRTGKVALVDNVLITDGNRHSIYVQDNTTFSNSEVQNSYSGADSNGVSMVVVNPAVGGSVVLENLNIHSTADAWGGTAILAHGATLDRLTLQNVTANTHGEAASLGNASIVDIIGGSYTSATEKTIEIFSADGRISGGTTVTNTYPTYGGGRCGVCFTSKLSVSASTIDLASSANSPILSNTSGAVLEIADSTILGGISFQLLQATGAVSLLRNLYKGALYYYFSSTYTSLTSDYNTFQSAAGGAPSGSPFWVTGGWKTLAAYRTATGQDANSTP